MRVSKYRRIISLMLIIGLAAGTLTACNRNASVKPIDLSVFLSEADVGENGVIGYMSYIKAYEENDDTAGITVPVTDEKSECLMGDSLSFPFEVSKAGLYRLCAEITGGRDTISDYYGALTIDGQYPFYECEQIYFSKVWVGDGDFDPSRQSGLKEDKNYRSAVRSDKSYEAGELYFYLTEGAHVLAFSPDNQSIGVNAIYFEGYSMPVRFAGEPKESGAESSLIQAENPASRSKSFILEQIDRTSAATVPVCLDESTYNTLGGNSWSALGESVTWEIPVETDGWYALNLRVRQDYSAGAVSCRRLLIDGNTLADGASQITVPYSPSWQKYTVCDEDGAPFWMYLEKGTHTVALECSLGSLESVVSIVESSISECNRIYRRIIMITGTDPDRYRDYNLDDKLPDVFESMERQVEVLTAVADYLSALSAGGESDAAVFRKLVRQFEEFLKDADNIPSQISTLSSNISAVGTWQLDCTSQPLEIDWLELQAYGAEGTDVKAGFFKQIGHSIVRILKSYTESYDAISNSGAERTIDVWAVTGRDQMQIVKVLSQDDFTGKTGIGVNLKLVSGDSVMAATVAGIGPDVTLFNGAPNVISYAIRKATVDLSVLEGFDDCIEDFFDSALVPYRFNGGVYALPETQSFPMLFYRTDILAELNIEVPTTWDEVYDCITTLQKNNMTFGCPVYDVFLYQNGGAYYNENGSVSLLNSEESVKAFDTWTKFYLNFNLPLSYNFINRFRSGEMPIAVADYSSYNSLVVFAPEISGSWEMTMVPGTVREDGTVDRSVSSSGTGAMIFSNTGDIDSSWRFLKWWVSGETQSNYAISIETKLGASARVMVSSRSAFETLDWTPEQAETLKKQWQWVDGTPEVAGGYLMSRHINNAFRKIVYNDADLRETLSEYKTIVDKELTLKREEYGLN